MKLELNKVPTLPKRARAQTRTRQMKLKLNKVPTYLPTNVMLWLVGIVVRVLHRFPFYQRCVIPTDARRENERKQDGVVVLWLALGGGLGGVVGVGVGDGAGLGLGTNACTHSHSTHTPTYRHTHTPTHTHTHTHTWALAHASSHAHTHTKVKHDHVMGRTVV